MPSVIPIQFLLQQQANNHCGLLRLGEGKDMLAMMSLRKNMSTFLMLMEELLVVLTTAYSIHSNHNTTSIANKIPNGNHKLPQLDTRQKDCHVLWGILSNEY